MKSIALFATLFCAVLYVSHASDDRCASSNEHWIECGSGCGEVTCATRHLQNPHRICPDVCRRGCVCNAGLIRLGGHGADAQNCVPLNHCPS